MDVKQVIVDKTTTIVSTLQSNSGVVTELLFVLKDTLDKVERWLGCFIDSIDDRVK